MLKKKTNCRSEARPFSRVVKALKIPKQNVQILWLMSQPELSCVTHGKTKLSEVFHLDSNISALFKLLDQLQNPISQSKY